ncbi:Solitary outer membrane autotransporter beta-barrel domain [Gilvimarinus sp. SDUM040013]|uniref:Solitary outer membrane autotransporter beta-barrel domain n=1 Tax=Gilvimarinus gilvus TaxID=3058038 RepID=A0ABU4S3L0_9GAMM|nr:Solitary outer membrane autotransporter beta-barrel domain [Gilvimarinus sp. SDUM040013]MDO3385462.1 Solitary outer membrane autotransporter beta-barrel domain [Gilvimarinus sp. SDUM040013]MDX6851121.1 Solitary outer membrane autotransporter beta-barrel domain [Gilvimarinus sp. SDUM040013]
MGVQNYAIGHTVATDSHAQDTTIETGRLSNTLVYHYDTPDVLKRRSQIRVLASRIDVGGDAVSPLGSHHYYELGAGWLIDTSNDIKFLNNIGVGLALNIGSNLSGGSLVILFNE